ncbi:sulfatase-like hydrolase/transferase [Pontiella sulfatireligans]|uniref:Choline-sulfatase n=1 Tax=Pontiella sulfatireligans TaxID=2750658 RepID=A0A6C2UFH8_9BACT|nr:sulfatase-like hydrolase/transferase [Pontiella sulfatireligans]SPS74277.1 sulfatase S1_16 [Kiritimatiellales bacterium]VGO18972.1 Choline-sulfatase [Pontiella sulfatireligans]
MKMKLFKVIILVLSCAALGQVEGKSERPNIVLLLIDDWAWYGSSVRMDDAMSNSQMPLAHMPNLEKLAAQGMKFRNAYAGAPQCAPSRVCIQTGKTSARSGYTLVLGKNQPDSDYDTRKTYEKLPLIPNTSDISIDADAFTIPEALKPLGYVSAHLGKWHMYSDPGAEGYVVNDGDTDNVPGSTIAKLKRMPEDHSDPKLMFSITEKSINFMRDQVKDGNPFYLQVSHYANHAFHECLPATREKYVNLPEVQAYYKKTKKTADTVNYKQDPAVWLGMLDDLDGRIGAVLDELKKLGIEDNTYVIVASDNGYRHKFFPGQAQPMHGAKWWVWQGGLRIPMLVKGPDIKAGAVFDANVINYDFLPTFVDWAGGNPESLKDIDGVSLAGYLRGKKPDSAFLNRYLYFHNPHYRSTMPSSAIVSGSKKVMHFYERPDIPMLFDLSAEDGEVSNIAKKNPEQHKQLFNEMMRYFDQVGARMPKVNPDYDPDHYKKLKDYDQRMTWGPFEGMRALDNDEQ